MKDGFLAILVGHIIGGIILYLAGIIGANKRCSASESINLSFGKLGSVSFSLLNTIQLIGWTSIMTIIGAQAFNKLMASLWNMGENTILWTIIIGLFPCIWIFSTMDFVSKINKVVMLCLLLASLYLGFGAVVSANEVVTSLDESMSFGMAVELNIAMCLSWMPVISDYTRTLKNQSTGTLSCVVAYCFGSILMYTIGLGSAVHYGITDICDIFMLSGLGVISLVVILLSTVTTNFITINSSSICLNHISNQLDVKYTAFFVCIISTLLAIFLSMEQYETFLYFIAATFAPLFAIAFSEYFFSHNIYHQNSLITGKNCLLWLIGFIAYELLIDYSTFIGITVPVMLAIAIINIFVNRLINKNI
jgi:putative hydroxymethylpyrimidine transporter CytX